MEQDSFNPRQTAGSDDCRIQKIKPHRTHCCEFGYTFYRGMNVT